MYDSKVEMQRVLNGVMRHVLMPDDALCKRRLMQ